MRKEILDLDIETKKMIDDASNPNLSNEDFEKLYNSSKDEVAEALINNPNCPQYIKDKLLKMYPEFGESSKKEL